MSDTAGKAISALIADYVAPPVDEERVAVAARLAAAFGVSVETVPERRTRLADAVKATLREAGVANLPADVTVDTTPDFAEIGGGDRVGDNYAGVRQGDTRIWMNQAWVQHWQDAGLPGNIVSTIRHEATHAVQNQQGVPQDTDRRELEAYSTEIRCASEALASQRYRQLPTLVQLRKSYRAGEAHYIRLRARLQGSPADVPDEHNLLILLGEFGKLQASQSKLEAGMAAYETTAHVYDKVIELHRQQIAAFDAELAAVSQYLSNHLIDVTDLSGHIRRAQAILDKARFIEADLPVEAGLPANAQAQVAGREERAETLRNWDRGEYPKPTEAKPKSASSTSTSSSSTSSTSSSSSSIWLAPPPQAQQRKAAVVKPTDGSDLHSTATAPPSAPTTDGFPDDFDVEWPDPDGTAKK